ncbi:AraC family transcriptional regulator [Paenibacillus sp. FA6]|uniref:AraC family transcriptional regulator n=1 Tax=Paenibacillus sp. FA6 TaxID=3413029 RepID=UPI003F65A663
MDSIAFPIVTEFDSNLPIYLTSAGHWDNQNHTSRPEGFYCYQWLQVISGEGELNLEGHTYPVSTGQAICLYPNIPHSYHAISEPWELNFISFDGNLCSTLLQQAGIHQSGVFSLTDSDAIMAHLTHLLTITSSERSYLSVECSKVLYTLILDLTKYVYTHNDNTQQNVLRLQPVMQYMKQNCYQSITIDQIATYAGISPQYLCSLFKKTLHIRPMEYINRERITRSKELMFLNPAKKIHQIAKESGYEHPSYFCTVFKRLEGMTPEQFKKSHGL